MAQESEPSGWQETVSILSQSGDIDVPCPKCGIANLSVRDSIGYRRANSLLVNRYVSCPRCGARKVIEGIKV